MQQIKFVIILFVSLCFSQKIVAQFDIPEIPKEQTSVYDYMSLLSPSEKSSLEQKLIKYSDTTSTQIVVVIIPTSKGENIGLLSAKWAHEWGIGQAKEDNGVFILLARDDRKIWISPGYGVEHKLTAGIVGELTRNVIIPEFKKDDYYSGLDKGTDAIFEVLMGEYQGTRRSSKDSGFPFGLIFFLFIIFIFILISISKNRRGGKGGPGSNSGGGFSILDAIILSNMGRGSYGGSSGGFGSSSGGGFSGGGFGGGFGGGGFSGGGAGGSW
ncbi:TPM domain-containing protein [Xanthomarina sp. F2636L]|uniref:TPM domain-containing protein n=1 Tax=Xanthomarina sp. F2636L TaxID=2996018 RepID=UPI00225DFE01|nr:TPM domain-containing protein [Xanthomarina sp. F2636L]MCX7552074.1 TPM domain-containing protein [Xanthomarina sp. F2636L]